MLLNRTPRSDESTIRMPAVGSEPEKREALLRALSELQTAQLEQLIYTADAWLTARAKRDPALARAVVHYCDGVIASHSAYRETVGDAYARAQASALIEFTATKRAEWLAIAEGRCA